MVKAQSDRHTLAYDNAILASAKPGPGLPADRWAAVTMPTLIVAGTKSPEWMQYGMQVLASALPKAEYRELDRQTHNVKEKAHAPLLSEFFSEHGRNSTNDPRAKPSFAHKRREEP